MRLIEAYRIYASMENFLVFQVFNLKLKWIKYTKYIFTSIHFSRRPFDLQCLCKLFKMRLPRKFSTILNKMIKEKQQGEYNEIQTQKAWFIYANCPSLWQYDWLRRIFITF